MSKRLVKRQRHPGWHLALSSLLLAGATIFLLYRPAAEERTSDLPVIAPADAPVPHQAANADQLADALYAGIDSALADLGIWSALYSKRRQEYFDRIEVGVPADLPLAEANLGISRFVQRLGGQVLSASERRNQVEIRGGFGEVQTTIFLLAPVAERRRTGNIAIVIDDFADDPIAAHFCAIPQSLTFSILPRASQAPALAERVRANGHEVLVHLPMEPQGGASLSANAILVGLDDEEIRRRVRRALRNVPHARGVNNHMGSKATANERVMRIVLSELKDRNLLFLDSRTTASSVAYQLAVDMDIRAINRDLFIDEIADAQTIQEKLWELAAIAAQSGQAIGVGHNRRETLIALLAALPQLEKRGFRFVPVSQLLP
ncbi:MAG: divergent polysaccharide deacetylase family protein [Gemmatimonadetes bacterium]|nr:divergent polysaccharide deacetylase family protein [Gemmatimonadota bacterium]